MNFEVVIKWELSVYSSFISIYIFKNCGCRNNVYVCKRKKCHVREFIFLFWLTASYKSSVTDSKARRCSHLICARSWSSHSWTLCRSYSRDHAKSRVDRGWVEGGKGAAYAAVFFWSSFFSSSASPSSNLGGWQKGYREEIGGGWGSIGGLAGNSRRRDRL